MRALVACVEDRWAYMEDGSAVCPRCGKRYERRKFEFVGACCEACGANNIVKTEIKPDVKEFYRR